MKKLIIIGIIIIVLLVVGYLLFFLDDSDSKKFASDYSDLDISKSNPIIYLDDESIVPALTSEDKLIFLGNPKSKDTKKAVSLLISSAKDNNVDKIYYYDTTGIDKKESIFDSLTKALGNYKVISPTLFLVKDKKINSSSIGITNKIETEYENLMIDYIMCTSDDC